MHIHGLVINLLEQMVEQVGIKSGIAISNAKFRILANKDSEIGDPSECYGWWNNNDNDFIRLEATELEEPFLVVMHQLGAIKDSESPNLLIFEWTRKHAPVFEKYNVSFEDLQDYIYSGKEPPEHLKEVVFSFMNLILDYKTRFILNWNHPDIRDWDGLISLDDLFQSENVPESTISGQYFDQRFIEYLNLQSDDLQKIHWRQFEYLCGEFFNRNGYEVNVTSARNDGGIDVIAKKENGIIGPEMIAIQAKRTSGKNTVKINEVKALWCDMEQLKASRCLIATTTRLEKNAREFCNARKYQIAAAENETVKQWIKALSRSEYC